MKKLLFWKHPKWRYGGYAFVVTAIVIAAVVLVNLGVGELETKNGWRKDLSFNNLTTQSETTLKVLNSLPYPVHIYALYTPGSEDLALTEVLNRYQTGSSLVTYEMLELSKNPGLLAKFQGNTETSLTANSLIVSCEATGRYKILTSESFSSVGYSIESGEYGVDLLYEKRITEALTYVTRTEIPEIMLLSGNNELEGDSVAALTQALTSNNYSVRSVNLRSGDELNPRSLLMILSPRKDLTQEELDSITAFSKAGGALFITCDFSDDLSDMVNYQSLLRSFGMVPLNGTVIASADEPGTYYSDTTTILTPHVLSGEATDPLIAAGAVELVTAGSRAFETPASAVSGLTVTPVLASGYKAYLRDIYGENKTTAQQDTDPVGPFSLALLSTRTQEDGTLSRAFILGSSVVLTESSLYESWNNLEFTLRFCEYLLNQKPISLDIISKPYTRPGLKAESRAVGGAVAVALPLMVLALALVILVPRRHR
jgi:ABC-2 type transport system permease protein